jgi:hypothetical protein
METQSRIRPGTPAGGQFAANAHPDAGAELLSAAAPKLPPWGQELDKRINLEVRKHTSDKYESFDMGTILDADEDALTEVYGEQRADWLSGLTVEIESDTYLAFGASDDGPAEYETVGKVSVFEAGGRLVTSAAFTDQDDPELGPVSVWAAQHQSDLREVA